MAPSATIVLLTAIAIVCIFPLPSSGLIDMKITLSCPGGYKNWCTHLFIYEEDPVGPNDFVAEKKYVCASESDPHANITVDFGTLDLGFDLLSVNYEIMPTISHNCSSNGKTYCTKPSNAYNVPIRLRGKPIPVNMAFTLTTENENPCDIPRWNY